MVLSVKEKATKSCQVRAMEMSDHTNPLLKCRKRRDSIKTRRLSLVWDKFGGNLFTVQAVDGIQGA